MRTLMCVLTGLLAASSSAQPVSLPDKQPDPVQRAKASERQTAFVIEIAAMDSGKASRAIRDAFDQAAQSQAPAVVLSILADCPWRVDVVRDVLLDMKACKSPVTVFLRDLDDKKTVSFGSLLVALSATRCAASERSLIVRVERDTARRVLVAEKTDWSLVEADVRELVAPHVSRRKLNEGSLDVLTWSPEDWWSVESLKTKPSTWTLVKGARPTGEKGARVLALNKAPRGGSSFEPFSLLTDALLGADADGFLHAEDLASLCRAAKLKAPQIRDVEIEESLESAASRAALLDEEAGLLRKKVDELLDAAKAGEIRPTEARSQAKAKLASLDRVDEAIVQLESLLTDYPELLRSPPPNYRSAGTLASSMPARWRSLIVSHRNSLTDLRERTRVLAEGK